VTDSPAREAKRILGHSRWWQIAAAAVMMALVSPYQYVWSSIEGPLASDLNASLSVVGFVFTAYVVIMALVQFPAGWWRDRYGPRVVTLVAGVLAGGGYYAIAFATEVWHLYVAYSIGAMGVGMVYTVAVNTAIKWFPDRRGLTTGIGTMAFAAGSAAFVPYVRLAVADGALANALTSMGVLICLGILVGTVVLKDPPASWREIEAQKLLEDDGTDAETDAADGPTDSTGDQLDGDGAEHAPDGGVRSFTWREMVRTWQFWIMYFMFFAVSAAGLMITARVVLYAEQAQLTAGAVTAAATILPLASGGGRLIVGGLSDYVDRERITAISFFLCGVATIAVVPLAGIESGIGYIVAVAVAVFFWSSQFSLFPSLVGDYYGAEHSSTNYSIIYSGKMWGGVFGGGVVGWLIGVLGWDLAFLLGGGLALAAGVVGFFLRPPR
jgi:MFS transporter, OFA family, oxalate/formate antiporter